MTRAFVDRYGSMLQVAHTDLGGNLDILASFLTTEQLLFDVVEQPEEVLRLVDQITDLWLRYYDELDAIIRPACRGHLLLDADLVAAARPTCCSAISPT